MSIKERLKIGSTVYFEFKGQIKKGIIIKKNPKRAEIQTNETSYLVPYLFLSLNEKGMREFEFFHFKKSYIKREAHLYELIDELKLEYKDIFKIFDVHQKQLLDKIKVSWNKRITYSRGARYVPSENRIYVSISFKETPKFVVKYILYRELLHIKYRNHLSFFRMYERQYKNYKEAKVFEKKLFKEIKYYGMSKINQLASYKKQAVRPTFKKLIKRKDLTTREKIRLMDKYFSKI